MIRGVRRIPGQRPGHLLGHLLGHALALGLLLGALAPAASGAAAPSDDAGTAIFDPALASGRALMEAVYARHQRYPFVYEEQAMVLVDSAGERQTRSLRRYSRVREDGSLMILLHFRYPTEVQGVALRATLYPDGHGERAVFLPALGPFLIANGAVAGNAESPEAARDDHFLGSDFSIENLIGENLAHYRYERREDQRLGSADYHVVDVFSRNERGRDRPDGPLRRHFILAQEQFISRTDHFDANGRVSKRQTHHDLVLVHGTTWRANMMLMDNRAEKHQTIIKINRRVFSPDYVPENVFTAEWIIANAPEPPVVEEPAERTGEGTRSEPLSDAARPAPDAGQQANRHALAAGAPAARRTQLPGKHP